MKILKIGFIILSFAFILSCGEDAQESSGESCLDSVVVPEENTLSDSATSAQQSATPSVQPGKRKISKVELERIIDDLGFQLEEMKGNEAELQASLKKLSKGKLNEQEKTENVRLEKSLSELQIKINKTLEKLKQRQGEMEGK